MDLSAYIEAGGGVRLANELGVTAPAVWQWASGVRPVPPARVIPIARATGWRVTPHELRPDIYPNPGDGIPPDADFEEVPAR